MTYGAILAAKRWGAPQADSAGCSVWEFRAVRVPSSTASRSEFGGLRGQAGSCRCEQDSDFRAAHKGVQTWTATKDPGEPSHAANAGGASMCFRCPPRARAPRPSAPRAATTTAARGLRKRRSEIRLFSGALFNSADRVHLQRRPFGRAPWEVLARKLVSDSGRFSGGLFGGPFELSGRRRPAPEVALAGR
jgi:hypothetical protein